MEQTVYPSLEEALYLHDRLIDRFGGTAGVRDMGLLESAVGRARSGYYKTLTEQAAALMQSFAMNHAFVDGNKRMAFSMCAVFLRLNGHRLRVQASVAEDFLVEQVICNKASVQEIAEWLTKYIVAV